VVYLLVRVITPLKATFIPPEMDTSSNHIKFPFPTNWPVHRSTSLLLLHCQSHLLKVRQSTGLQTARLMRNLTLVSDSLSIPILNFLMFLKGYRVVETRNLKRFWKIGRVFMMLWTSLDPELVPEGGGTRNGSDISTTWLKGEVYSEIRRFVVIAEGYGNIICS
jgi:hypothetical protein